MKKLAMPAFRLISRALFVTVVLPVLWLLEPWLRPRLMVLYTARIGHLCFNTHVFAARRLLNGPEASVHRLILAEGKPCNQALLTLWRRVLPFTQSRLLSAFYYHTCDLGERTRFYETMPHTQCDYREINTGPLLSLTPTEEDRGRQLCAEMGLPPDAWFICFQASDPAYHNVRSGKAADALDERRHRNADVDTYLDAVTWIAEQGGWALRVGATVEKPLPATVHPQIIDYSSTHRSEFGDIYLLARCRFFLASATGTHSVPPLFSVPVAMANHMPPTPQALGRRSLYQHKLLRDKVSGRVLTYGEWRKLGLFRLDTVVEWDYARTFEAHGIEWVDNTAWEILDLCREMMDEIEGRQIDSDAVACREEFTARYCGHLPDIDYAARFSARFAWRHRDLMRD